MRGVGQSELGKELSESQRAALISLLGDDDQAVYEEIRARLISCGPIAATWLRPHRLSGDPALRRRAQELVNHFDRQTADDRFLFFCLKQGSDLDIEEGAWLLAGTKHPAINIEG